MPNLITKDGEVVEILPNTNAIKDYVFDEETEEILHTLMWLERSLVLLDERIANTPWYERWWDNVRCSDWYNRLWNKFQSSTPSKTEEIK